MKFLSNISKVSIFTIFFLSNVFAQIDRATAHMAEALPKKEIGKELYNQYCASCHHEKRVGIDGPPLLPNNLKKYDEKDLASKIKDGFPQTLMPKYDFLSLYELHQIARYIKSPIDKVFSWDLSDINKSITSFKDPLNPLNIKDKEQILPVVERDGNKTWIMEDRRVLSKFPLNNIHGGIKFTMDAKTIYVPTRDGWIQNYSLETGQRMNKIRACINLRNISLSRDEQNLFATCLLPEQLVVMNPKTMEAKDILKIDGKISALYELYSKDEAIFTFRDKPLIGRLDTKTNEIKYIDIKEPIEDFFIDPFDDFLIGTARGGDVLRVYSLKDNSVVFEHEMKGMPHLFSATYWYKDGNFYFATPHIKKSYITIWKMYDWEFVKEVDIKGDGFFVKTHPNTPYLWADNGSDKLVLIDKNDYSLKTITPREGKKYIHTEYSGDGKYAYLSIYEQNGEIIVIDTNSFKELASYDANVPVGKYNFINKNREFYPRLFGIDIFKQNCNSKLPCDSSSFNYYENKSFEDFKKTIK
ncbi:nitrite reductase [Aliarcobacter cryaerophilus]|uniref:nitrite reductase n=1 Tax=Aliarcobacter cryaerophilus TaxID=28198 RepID=UPI0021B46C59|nr:nitrite reductase [Aliarcobacter cryaerophilus]MCT7506344.1 nitrite reductase [Aliarcobacter cryaerophilus]